MKVHKNFKKVTIICLIPVLVCLFMLGLNEYNSNFTSSKWSEKPSKRVEIIDDLLLNYDFKGMTKNEVINILGTPSETEYFKKDNNIVYHLGYERGLISIDSEWLVINFDGNEIVINYDVVTD
ncbi:outer membrane protein assembly factor BamE [Bacillus sp. B1-b2]|uniref:outer membrane protein assembly factor BamE domain-containing protein n=1 Tax=Bacillus sp. B1-b2 TaxID=2653201 RepID=UPI00186A192E|nr:outer membrane protein assembly factor BamE [Bacillus sp. B1-b2]